jgi:CheY-like chemotaxis protein
MKILVIEDEKILAQTIQKGFDSLGHEVVVAYNGEDGLNKALTEPNLDLIFLDLMLPIIDGFEILSKVKSDPQTQLIPVVITSNIAEEGKIQQSKLLGADDYLIKSNISLENLIELADKYQPNK